MGSLLYAHISNVVTVHRVPHVSSRLSRLESSVLDLIIQALWPNTEYADHSLLLRKVTFS